MKNKFDFCLNLLNESSSYLERAKSANVESVVSFRGDNIARGRDLARYAKECLISSKKILNRAKREISRLEVDGSFSDYFQRIISIAKDIEEEIANAERYIKGDTLKNLKENITDEQRRRLALDSLSWFYRQINRNRNEYDKDAFKPIKLPFAGSLIHFVYDAKWKEILPIWDRFPLLIMLKIDGAYFYGLNIHYLRIDERVILLDMIKQHKRSNWQAAIPILLESERARLLSDCFRVYLFSQVRSSFVEIDEKYWNSVSFLPTAQWVTRSKNEQ